MYHDMGKSLLFTCYHHHSLLGMLCMLLSEMSPLSMDYILKLDLHPWEAALA